MKDRDFPPGVVWNRAGLVGVLKQVPKDVWAHPDWAKRSKTVERSTHTRDRAEGLRRAMRILVELEDSWEQARRDLGASGPIPVAAMTPPEIEAFADTAETLIALEHDPEVSRTGEPLPADPGRLVEWVAGALGQAPAPHLLPVLAEAVAARLADPTPTTPEARYAVEARRVLAPAPKRRPTRTLADLIALFEAERLASLDPRSKSNYTTAFAALREVVGEATPLALIDRDTLRAVRDAITARPLAIASQRKYVRAVGTLFTFAVAERWMDANPALGLAPKARPEDEGGGRRPFNRAELAKMFPKGWRPVSAVDWLLALGLFQGMRAEEIAQLETIDIAQVGGVWAIHIRAWSPSAEGGRDRALGKSIKNDASERVIPIHARIEADLIALANARRKAGERMLLPGVKRYGLEGYYGSLRKALDAHLASLGVKSPGMRHHALRHNFRDACRAANIPREHVLTLGGWSLGKGAEADYGEAIPPAALKPSLDALAFPVP